MGEVRERELDYGVVEQRTYDENGQLVDVRKIYPKMTAAKPPRIPRSPGAYGGHEF